MSAPSVAVLSLIRAHGRNMLIHIVDAEAAVLIYMYKMLLVCPNVGYLDVFITL